jgi:hypothetical protein
MGRTTVDNPGRIRPHSHGGGDRAVVNDLTVHAQVRAQAAVEVVAPVAPIQGVVACVAVEDVVSSGAGDHVVASHAGKMIRHGVASDRVAELDSGASHR